MLYVINIYECFYLFSFAFILFIYFYMNVLKSLTAKSSHHKKNIFKKFL